MIERKFKIILIGDIRVGKTSFLYCATGKSQNNIQPTMGIQFLSTSISLHNKPFKVQIWDTSILIYHIKQTAGAQTYRSITSTYYKKAQGVILMFDLSNRNTFENVKRWNKEVDQKAKQSISKILIGNKIDLIQEGIIERQVSQQEITNFCIENQMTYKETSALKGTHVKEALLEIIQSNFIGFYQGVEIYQSGFDVNPGNQYTSFMEPNHNTTILLEPPLPVESSHSGVCNKCC